MRGNEEADRAIDTGEFFDDGGVFDVAEAGTAVFLREDDTHEAHFGEFGEKFGGKVGDFVPLHNVGSDFAFGKFADTCGGGFVRR